jgi:hypothetical protein
MNLPTLLTKKYRKTSTTDGLQVIDLHPLAKSYLDRYCSTINHYGEFVDGVRQVKEKTHHIDLKAIKKELKKQDIKVDAIKIDPRTIEGEVYIAA